MNQAIILEVEVELFLENFTATVLEGINIRPVIVIEDIF